MNLDLNKTTSVTETLELEELSESDLKQVNGGTPDLFDVLSVSVSVNVTIGNPASSD